MREMLVKKISDVLDWAYEKAIEGVPGMDSVEEFAEEYLSGTGTLDKKIDRLVKWQSVKCATSGFLTSVGGFMSLPVGISANISSVIYLQLRMVAAIAYMRGYDVRDSRVKIMSFICLCGKGANQFLKEAAGIGIENLATKIFAKKVTEEIVQRSNEAVSKNLATRFGGSTVGKVVPIASGIASGIIDASFTRAIGAVAKKAFVEREGVYAEFREIE